MADDDLQKALEPLFARAAEFDRTQDVSYLVSAEADSDMEAVWAILEARLGRIPAMALQAFGTFYWNRFAVRQGSSFDDLYHAVQLLRPLYSQRPEVLPDHIKSLMAKEVPRDEFLTWESQAEELRKSTGQADLDKAVKLAAQAAEGCPVDSEDYTRLVFNLSQAIWARFEIGGKEDDIDWAVNTMAYAAYVSVREPAFRPMVLLMQFQQLRVRWDRRHELKDLDAAIAVAEEATRMSPDVFGVRGIQHGNLSRALSTRFREHGDPADAAAAVDHARRCLAYSQLEDQTADRAQLLAALADVTVSAPAGPEANEAIQIGREILQGESSRQVNRIGVAIGTSRLLRARASATGDGADLDLALDICRTLVRGSLEDSSRPMMYTEYTKILEEKYLASDDLAVLDECISAAWLALDCSDAGQRPQCAVTLAVALGRRYQRTAIRADLDERISILQDALAAGMSDQPGPPGDSQVHKVRGLLAGALVDRYKAGSRGADLSEAIDLYQAALQADDIFPPLRRQLRSELARTLSSRADLTGARTDIEAAVDLARANVADPGEQETEAAAELASHLVDLYRTTLELPVLSEIITIYRRVIDQQTGGHERAAQGLAEALRLRFDRTFNRADIDESISVNAAALATLTEADARWAPLAASLGTALRVRYREGRRYWGDEEGRQIRDIDESIAWIRQAVAATAPNDHRAHARRQGSLGQSLRHRFETRGELPDLDEAIEAYRGAAAESSLLPDDRSALLANFSLVLRTRGELRSDVHDLDEAVRLSRDALAAVRDSAVSPATQMLALGSALRYRYVLARREEDLDEALAVLARASHLHSANPATRYAAASGRGQLARDAGRWSEASDGYADAIELLPLLAWLGAGRSAQEQVLANRLGVVQEGVACALDAGQLERALDMLESGRGILWSQQLEIRGSLTALEQHDPDLASQISAASTILDDETTLDRDQQVAQATELEQLLVRARKIPGFSDLLRPPRPDALLGQLTAGSIVFINTSWHRCDALIADSGGIRCLPLSFGVEEAVGKGNEYLSAIQNFEVGLGDQASRQLFEHAITEMLRWLWEKIAEPVLRELQLLTIPGPEDRWPRIWWCPTGPLALLPIHAAGVHTTSDTDGESVMDRVVSSYTSSLRALVSAQRQASPRPKPESNTTTALFVGLAHTTGQADLPGTAYEASAFTMAFAEAGLVLAEETATRQAVLDALAAHSWAHFSCHGLQDLTYPSRGGLLLADGLLSIPQLIGMDASAGELVYLSACKTAIGGVRIPDESITLAAAFYFVGWRHVIGTLWSVWDRSSAHISTMFYRSMDSPDRSSADHSASVLHHAIRNQRDAAPSQPSRWAPFIHFGP